MISFLPIIGDDLIAFWGSVDVHLIEVEASDGPLNNDVLCLNELLPNDGHGAPNSNNDVVSNV